MRKQAAKVIIPENLMFSDLNLDRHSNGDVSFEWGVIESICEESFLPVELLRDTHEENVVGLIVQWYFLHRHHGGTLDPVAEELINEALAEAGAGQPFSHQPGRA